MKSGLVYLRPSRLAYVRHTGPYETSVPAAWQQLSSWLAKSEDSPALTRGYGLMRDSLASTAADKCRYDACIELDPFLEERAMRELGAQTLPGGSYMRVRNVGTYADLQQKLIKLHTEFEAPVGLKLDMRRPLVAIYLANPLRTEDATLRADICIPVAAAAAREAA